MRNILYFPDISKPLHSSFVSKLIIKTKVISALPLSIYLFSNYIVRDHRCTQYVASFRAVQNVEISQMMSSFTFL